MVGWSLIGLGICFIIMMLMSCDNDAIDLSPDCLGEKQPDLMCTEQVDLVCGCDGTTYMNSCYATRAGVLKVRPQAIDNDNCNPW